jgi:hypothetical protein
MMLARYSRKKKNTSKRKVEARGDGVLVREILAKNPNLRKKHFKPISTAKCFIKGFSTTCDFMGMASNHVLRGVRKDVIAQLQQAKQKSTFSSPTV